MAVPRPERLAPEFVVRVAGRELPPRARADVVQVSVHEDVEMPAMFACELLNWDQDRVAMTWSDADTFHEGRDVEIGVGYRDAVETLFTGEITALELAASASGVPLLSVQGYDRSHRLTRSHRVRAFSEMSDGDIARQVAEDAGLTAEVTVRGQHHAHVLQCNQTDLEFLRERADRVGAEVVVRGRTLAFRARPASAAPVATLSREADLIEFRSRLTTLAPASLMEVRGWDPATKRTIVGRAGKEQGARAMGGQAQAGTAVARQFGEHLATWMAAAPDSQGEADAMARAALDRTALRYVEADGVCMGRPDVRAGTVVELAGLGDRFSGPYYVTATTHTYTPSRGYRTRFAARRNAS